MIYVVIIAQSLCTDATDRAISFKKDTCFNRLYKRFVLAGSSSGLFIAMTFRISFRILFPPPFRLRFSRLRIGLICCSVIGGFLVTILCAPFATTLLRTVFAFALISPKFRRRFFSFASGTNPHRFLSGRRASKAGTANLLLYCPHGLLDSRGHSHLDRRRYGANTLYRRRYR